LHDHGDECHAKRMDSTDSRTMTKVSFRLPLGALERLRGVAAVKRVHVAHLLADAIEAHVKALGGPFTTSEPVPRGRPPRGSAERCS
jgi:hypothetical protein